MGMIFPTVIQTQEDPKISQGQVIYTKQMGQVHYYFDTLSGILYREEANYSLALQKKFFQKKPVLSSLQHIQFFYYALQDRKLTKLDQIDVLPVIVQIVIQYNDAQGHRRVMQKSILLPNAQVEDGQV